MRRIYMPGSEVVALAGPGTAAKDQQQKSCRAEDIHGELRIAIPKPVAPSPIL